MRVYLLRHGATEATAEGRYQGWLDAPLSLAGRRALQRAAFSPQHVYVSPLRRAVETAALWFPEAEQIPVPELREMDFGSFEGYTWRELSGNAAYCAWVDSGCEAPIPGGEGKAIFCARVCATFAAILNRETAQQADTVVFVVHGGTIMAVLSSLTGGEYFDFQVKNGEGYETVLEWIQGSWKITSLTKIGCEDSKSEHLQ